MNLRSSSRTLLVASLLLWGALAERPPANAADGPDFQGWYSGGEGLLEALEIHRRDGTPMFVYFYTDWCGYCRQFERVLLSDPRVDQYMDGILAVRINPEKGRLAGQLGQTYRVSGFPTLFMYSGSSRSITAINRMDIVDGEPRLKDAEDFIRTLDDAARR